MKDDLGDRMKYYEGTNDDRLIPLLPAMARLDGKCFHKFTKGMKRPFDGGMNEMMCRTTCHLVEKTNACIGYTQSDEITLCWYNSKFDSQIFFNGRTNKMNSVLAAMASVYFNSILPDYFSDKVDMLPVFDCRVWNVPTQVEAANAILWREQDATKNSVSMAARAYYSHKQLNGKSRAEMMDMLMEKGVNWNDYDPRYKRGTYYQKREIVKGFTEEERVRLPDNHPGKKDPDFKFVRKVLGSVDMPPLSKVVNRVGVIFDGETPKIAD